MRGECTITPLTSKQERHQSLLRGHQTQGTSGKLSETRPRQQYLRRFECPHRVVAGHAVGCPMPVPRGDLPTGTLLRDRRQL